MIRACDVCGERRSEHLFDKHGCTLLRCHECGFVYMDRTPDRDVELARLYRDPAYFGGGGYYLDYLAHERHHRLLARRILDTVTKRFTPVSWLDVGCAAGFLLDEARARGLSVRGIDLSESMVEHAVARGLDVRVETLASSALSPASFDVVSFCDSLEHVEDPAAELRAAHRVLEPEGRVVIHTPNVESTMARMLGSNWPHFTPPEHVSYFARPSLARLLAKTGFSVVQAQSLGHWFSIGEIAAKLVPAARRFVHRPARTLVYLDVGDLLMIGEKPRRASVRGFPSHVIG